MATEKTTREMLIGSWHAAKRQADQIGGVTLNSTSFAGYAIEQAGGSIAMARVFVPDDATPFWGRVRDCLDRVMQEERDAARGEIGERIRTTLDDVLGGEKVPA